MSEIFFGWQDHIPPAHWQRILAFDVGGATPNALQWFAKCPDTQSLVAYDEVHIITTDMSAVAALALPKMKFPGSENEYEFIAKVGDYENRIALDDMAKHGIRFTNAVKQNKTVSVHRFASYLHPNPRRPFPAWHPNAGKLGAPLLYITPNCKNLIAEIPQQKWKNEKDGTTMKDELDRSVRHDHVDCGLYVARIMPAPTQIPIPKIVIVQATTDINSKMYWAAARKKEAEKTVHQSRKPYSTSHGAGGDKSWVESLLGFSLSS